jgi:hypothetical protein
VSAGVGAVNVSNEPGPQSETSIAINPANPKQLVAGSNEIFRLPMRGYFSSDGGATWGGVDLPLPPAIWTNGYDFGSDPGVAWDLHGNVSYRPLSARPLDAFWRIGGDEAESGSGD